MSASTDCLQDAVKPRSCFGIRHLQSLLLFFGMILAFAMRVNMSLAIVAMTDPNGEYHFDWSVQKQSVILSSFFWGYIIPQIPAGVIAEKIGGKWPVIIVVFINSVISLVLPISAHYGGWLAVCACRVAQGLSQGFLYPGVHALISKWVPLPEKSRLGTFIYAGAQLGTAAQLIAAGFVADYLGWPFIFYTVGILGCIWTVFYIFLGANDPQNSRIISDEERHYIQTSLGQVGEQKKLSTPWKAIVSSLPFLALIIVHCGQNWGFWTLMTEMPSYMKQVLDVDIKANGVMSALPYLAMWLMSFPFGFISDYILKKQWLTITGCRKLSNSIGHFGPAIALIGLSFAPAGNVSAAVIMLTVVVGLNAGHITGFLLVHIDMAPNFGGSLMGITNFFANIISIIAPLVAGAILKDETSADDWRKVFYLSSAIYVLCNTFFLIFGTSKQQAWNNPEQEKSPEEGTNKTEKVI